MRTLLKSSPLQRLAFPDLFVTASTAIGLTYYNTEIATDYASQIMLDGSAMAGATTAIGLFAAFRLNASYGRYDEGRKFWGEINNACRDLAGNTMMWLETKEQKDRMLKLIKAFPVGMQFHLNKKGGHYLIHKRMSSYREQIYAEFYAEMNDIFQDENDDDFIQICEAYKNKGHVPLLVVSGMRKMIAENGTWVEPIYNKDMDEQVRRLVGCMGMCERVLGTPIPTCFTRHSSRLFFLWSNLLPFAMYSGCGPLGTLPASLMVTYAILGIEDIGVQLEEPFNILPLRQYSEGIYAGVDSIRDSYAIPGTYAEKKSDLFENQSVAMEEAVTASLKMPPNGHNGAATEEAAPTYYEQEERIVLN
jgi:putative membrane protein